MIEQKIKIFSTVIIHQSRNLIDEDLVDLLIWLKFVLQAVFFDDYLVIW